MAARRQHELPGIGTLAPAFRLARLEGGEATLAGLSAETRVLLVFFKITCPVCQLTLPFLERLHASGGLAVYGVSQNDAGDTREFNEHFKVTLPVLLDSEAEGYPASNAYGSPACPPCSWSSPGV